MFRHAGPVRDTDGQIDAPGPKACPVDCPANGVAGGGPMTPPPAGFGIPALAHAPPELLGKPDAAMAGDARFPGMNTFGISGWRQPPAIPRRKDKERTSSWCVEWAIKHGLPTEPQTDKPDLRRK